MNRVSCFGSPVAEELNIFHIKMIMIKKKKKAGQWSMYLISQAFSDWVKLLGLEYYYVSYLGLRWIDKLVNNGWLSK